MKHTPVYKQEFMDALQVAPGKLYVDATYGQGGYTQEILDKGGRVLALDRDARQIRQAPHAGNANVMLVAASYADIAEVAKAHDVKDVDGVVFDLGLSYEQMMQSGRGFSFQALEQPLDMRLNPDAQTETAAKVLQTCDKDELYEVFSRYGEELAADALAAHVVAVRKHHPFVVVADLIQAINEVIRDGAQYSYARIFQALRMRVNEELDHITRGIDGAIELLAPEGRLVVVTFHSIEDRLVKRLLQQSPNLTNQKRVIKKNPEPYERSATLRVAQKRA